MDEAHDPTDRRVRAALLNATARVTVLCEPDGRIAWVSESVRRLLGHDPEQLVGTPVFELYCQEDAVYSRIGFRRAVADPTSSDDQVGAVARAAKVRHADGTLRIVESYPTLMLSDPTVRGILLEWTPVADHRYLTDAIDAVASAHPATDSLRRVVDLARAYLSTTDVGLAVPDGDAWEVVIDLLDVRADDVIDRIPSPHDARWAAEFTMSDRSLTDIDGRESEVGFRPIHGSDGRLLAAFVLVRSNLTRLVPVVTSAQNMVDVAFRLTALTLQDEHQRNELLGAAEIDPLTGLANRAGLTRRFNESRPHHEKALVMYLDLDDFKPVNDRFGHAAGDQVLCEIGRRLSSVLRDDDIACRIGGDEFLAVCFATWDDDGAAALTARVAATLERPVALQLADGSVTGVAIGVSVGAALGAPTDLDALLADADCDLYTVKRRRKAAGAPA